MSSAVEEPCLEISVDSAWLAEAALLGNADALEISKGGTTPSHELFVQVKEVVRQVIGNGRDWEYFPVTICIHPRPGHFVYSQNELNTIMRSIKHFKKERLVKGFTVAALTPAGDINVDIMSKLKEAICPKQIHFSGRAFEYIDERKMDSILKSLNDIGSITYIRSKEVTSLKAPQSPRNDHALPLVTKTDSMTERYGHPSPQWKITRTLSSYFLSKAFLDRHPYIFFLLHHYSRNTVFDCGLSYLGHRLFLNACPTWKDVYDLRGREAAIRIAQHSILQIHSATGKAWVNYRKNKHSIYPDQTLYRLISEYTYEQAIDNELVSQLYSLQPEKLYL